MEVFSWHEGLGKWIEIANVSWTQCAHAIKADVSVRCVQARNAGADGSAEGREGIGVGNESGTADYDQVSLPQYGSDPGRGSKLTRYQVQDLRYQNAGGAQDGSGYGQEEAGGAAGEGRLDVRARPAEQRSAFEGSRGRGMRARSWTCLLIVGLMY